MQVDTQYNNVLLLVHIGLYKQIVCLHVGFVNSFLQILVLKMGNLAVAKKHFAVIGHPVGHSMSDFIHTQLFELSGLDADYVRLDVSPDALKLEYERTLSALDGFNVTIPHKQSIIPMLSSLDGCAAAFGSFRRISGEAGVLLSAESTP